MGEMDGKMSNRMNIRGVPLEINGGDRGPDIFRSLGRFDRDIRDPVIKELALEHIQEFSFFLPLERMREYLQRAISGEHGYEEEHDGFNFGTDGDFLVDYCPCNNFGSMNAVLRTETLYLSFHLREPISDISHFPLYDIAEVVLEDDRGFKLRYPVEGSGIVSKLILSPDTLPKPGYQVSLELIGD